MSETKVISLGERAKDEEKPFLERFLQEGARKLLTGGYRTKGCGSRIATVTMVLKLGIEDPETLAAIERIGTDSQSGHWCSICRRRAAP